MWNSSKPDFRCHWRRKRLCGAKNVLGSLRWLKADDTFNAESASRRREPQSKH